jgi:hypothetical protein
MTNFYLITTFLILLVGAEAADKATLDTRHLPDQWATISREGWLASQRSRALGRDAQVVDARGVQRHLSAEPTEQAIDAPLQGRRPRLQNLEAGMIQSFSLPVSFSY